MNGFVAYLLRQALGEILLVVFLVGPLAGLTALCILTWNNLPPQRRRGLSALFFTLLALAAVLFGGALVLRECGLVWRTWLQEGMSVVLWLVGLATGTATIAYGWRWLQERFSPAKGAALLSLSLFCLASVMVVGTVIGGLWCLGPGEQVVTYAGQKAVFGTWTWMGTSYSLYEYHGPLVRGAEPIVIDWSLLEGAVINAG